MNTYLSSYLTLSFVVALLYLSLAVYVLVHRGRDTIAWVFAGFCLTIFGTYLMNLFLVVRTPADLARTLAPIRLRWALICLGPVLYLHLNAFFFGQRWREVVFRWLAAAYGLSGALSLGVLLTPWFIVAPTLSSNGVARWQQGPLFLVYWVLMGVSMLISIIGLVIAFRQARLRLVQQQIVYMLLPIGLLVVGMLLPGSGGPNYENALIREGVKSIVLVAGLLYARAVLEFGTIVGRPLSSRGFLLLIVAIIGVSISFGGLLAADGWLGQYTPFPLPILTTLTGVVVALGYWLLRHQIRRLLRNLFLAGPDMAALGELPHFRELQTDADATRRAQLFLRGMCETFRARGGFVATRTGERQADVLTTWQLSEPRDGAAITLPPLLDNAPHFVTAFGSLLIPDSFWQEMVLVCPLQLRAEPAVLVLAEKEDRSAYTHADLAYGARMVAWFEGLVPALEREATSPVAPALPVTAALGRRRLGAQLAARPLAVYALRPLTVAHHGERVSQEMWGSEKAKGMLAYLLWCGEHGATREALCDALWPNRDDAESRNVFHVTLHRLRRVLEPERKRGSSYVVYDHHRYRLLPAAEWWTDVAAFERLAQNADVPSLTAAVDLYRAPFLEDMSWALPADAEIDRRRLELLYEQALRQLVAALPPGERAEYLRLLVQLYPEDGPANEMLLSDYLLLGRNDLAQRHMDWLREMTGDDEIDFN